MKVQASAITTGGGGWLQQEQMGREGKRPWLSKRGERVEGRGRVNENEPKTERKT
jgi:hypothetical protein